MRGEGTSGEGTPDDQVVDQLRIGGVQLDRMRKAQLNSLKPAWVDGRLRQLEEENQALLLKLTHAEMSIEKLKKKVSMSDALS